MDTIKYPTALVELFYEVIGGNGVEINDTAPPELPVELGEQVIGTLEDPFARHLWALREKIDEYVEDLKAVIGKEEECTAEEAGRIYQISDTVSNMRRILSSLFWMRVKEEFPDLVKQGITIGIRKDWQVVAMKDESCDIPSVLAGLVATVIAAKLAESVGAGGRN